MSTDRGSDADNIPSDADAALDTSGVGHAPLRVMQKATSGPYGPTRDISCQAS
jgi:hypothetical protein